MLPKEIVGCEIMSSASRSRRNVGRNDLNISWNPGDPIPTGAGLPAQRGTGTPIVSIATFGEGTLNDPCVSFLHKCVLAMAS